MPRLVPSKRLRWRMLAVVGVALAAWLLWPAREPSAPPPPAQAHPFEWGRDPLWSRLEASFASARAAGCEAVQARAASLQDELDSALVEVARDRPDPGAAVLDRLMDQVFELGPLTAACPDLFPSYLDQMSRLRSEVKRLSTGWDMSSPVTRRTLYTLLYGSRAALEEVMLQLPEGDVPALVHGVDGPSGTPAATLLGVEVHSGDLLVSRGGAPTSALIARGNDFPGNFSHVALLEVDADGAEPHIVEAHIERGVVVSSLDQYLADTKLRIMVLRPRPDLPALRNDPMLPHRAALAAFEAAASGHIPYDFAMDYTEHSHQFCSEVASAAYERLGVRLWMGLSSLSSPGLRRWLAGFGVCHFVTQEPSDLEYDPQLVVVAEWRDPETLFRDHLDNAVTDVMLEGAERGDELACPWFLLPAARMAKAWSVACNLVGAAGPVPEGMPAAAALRNRSYSERHHTLVVRLTGLADRFRATHGYRPPYWELVQLARGAAAREDSAGTGRPAG